MTLPPPGTRTRRTDIDPLLEQTRHSDAMTRRRAVHQLCPCALRADDDRVWDRLLEIVGDDDARVRADVFHTFCDGSPRSRESQVVQALECMQHDPDPKLRRRVRKMLAQYRAGGSVNIL